MTEQGKDGAVLEGRSLLVVDDEEDIRTTLSRYLARRGAIVRTACNGMEALQAIQAERPDAVICDRRMPEMSGAELIEQIRAQYAELEAMPFIFLTALADRRDMHAMVDFRPFAYLAKPIDFAELLEVLGRALNK